MPTETTCPVCRRPVQPGTVDASGKPVCPYCRRKPRFVFTTLKVAMLAVLLVVSTGAAGVFAFVGCPSCRQSYAPLSPAPADVLEEKKD